MLNDDVKQSEFEARQNVLRHESIECKNRLIYIKMTSSNEER